MLRGPQADAGLPSDIKVFEAPGAGAAEPAQLTLSVLLNQRQLYLWKVSDAPVELEFQQKYGAVVSYAWFADRRVMIGFASGFFVIISTHIQDIGQELFQARNHRTRLAGTAYNVLLAKAATVGDDCVKIHDLAHPSDVSTAATLEDERGMLDGLAWSDDGQLLAVTSQTGAVHTFLCKISALGAAFGVRTAYLSALDEVTTAMADESELSVKIHAAIEPAFLACA